MEQLWYTWSLNGFGTAAGWRTRAASPKLVEIVNTTARFQDFGMHLGYQLPQVTEATLPPKQTATCLAFIKPGRNPAEQSRILVNKRISSSDNNNQTIHFSHLLTDLPAGFTAREAISLWKSRFWKDKEEIEASERSLPSVADNLLELLPGLLTASDLAGLEQELTQAIHAFLLLEIDKGERLYIAAHPDVVARLIWGLTHVLPDRLMKELTFSTYEKDVAQSRAAIVGTCWSSTAQKGNPGPLQNLPVGWKGLAINWYVGRASARLETETNSLEAEYARFAALALVQGQKTDLLKELLEQAEEEQIASIDAFKAAYQAVVKGVITRQAIVNVLSQPYLAPKNLKRPSFQTALLNVAMNDPNLLAEQVLPLLEQVRKQATLHRDETLLQSLLSMAKKASDEGVQAIKNRQEKRAYGAFRVMAVAAPPSATGNREVWVSLLTTLNTARIVSEDDEVSTLLLQCWAHMAKHIDSLLLLPWFNYTWGALSVWLEQITWLPEAWYPLLIHHLLRQPFPAGGVQIVGRYARVFTKSFAILVRDATEWDSLERFMGVCAQAGMKSEIRIDLLLALLTPKILNSPLPVIDAPHIKRLLQAAALSSGEMFDLLKLNSGPVVVKALFDLLIEDVAWRQKYGQRLLKRLCSEGVSPDIALPFAQVKRFLPGNNKVVSPKFVEICDHLADLSTTAIYKALQSGDKNTLDFLQANLPDLAPPKDKPGPWVRLLQTLAQEQEVREQARSWLLTHCAEIPDINPSLIDPWLVPTWEAFPTLLKQQWPPTWYGAMLKSLLAQRKSPLPKSALKVVEEYAQWFAQVLSHFFQDVRSREDVVVFLGQLTEQHTSQRVALLGALLVGQGVQTAEVEWLWQTAKLSEDEEFQTLEVAGEQLVILARLSPQVIRALGAYLDKLTLQNLDRTLPLITALRTQANKQEHSQLVPMLTRFSDRVIAAIKKTIDAPDEREALAFIRLLEAAAPPAQVPHPWHVLLEGLHPLAEKRAPSNVRWRLLTSWGMMAEHQQYIEQLQPWLTINLKESRAIDQLGSMIDTLPPAFYFVAVIQALPRFGEPLPRGTSKLVESHLHQFGHILGSLHTDERQWRAGIKFVVLLARDNFSKVLELMNALLQTADLEADRAKLLWEGVPLSLSMRQQFLVRFSGLLLQHPAVSQEVKDFLRTIRSSTPQTTEPKVAASGTGQNDPPQPPLKAIEGAARSSTPAQNYQPQPAPERLQDARKAAQEVRAVEPRSRSQEEEIRALVGPGFYPHEDVPPSLQQEERSHPEGSVSSARGGFHAASQEQLLRSRDIINMFIFPSTKKFITLDELAQALQYIPDQEREKARWSLLPGLAKRIDSPGQLGAVLETLGPLLTKDALLLGLTEQVKKNNFYPPEILAKKLDPYLQWLLLKESYDPTEQNSRKLASYLDHILNGLPPKALREIDKNAEEGWQDAVWEQWKAYRTNKPGTAKKQR